MDVLPAYLSLEHLGDELVVLGVSEIRIAERADRDQVIETADGPVRARPGDFIVSMPSGERYPIQACIFFGGYEILSVVGRWFVGRRLRTARRAWPVTAPAIELDYGTDRGIVSASCGAWVYQSDEQDFGVINEDAYSATYEVVGAAAELTRCDWHARFARLTTAVILMPSLLIGISLLALTFPMIGTALLVVEAVLLLVGVGAVWWSRRAKWSLKAAVVAGRQIARDCQVAVAALGSPVSDRFPIVALWRAAQDTASGPAQLTPENLRNVKNMIDRWREYIRHESERHHRAESIVEALPWAAAILMLICMCWVLVTHDVDVKLFSIWLPSVVSTAHAWHWHGQVSQRAQAAIDMARMLRFVKTRLTALAPHDEIDPADAVREGEVIAALRMLCLCAAQHSLRELSLAAAEEAHVPV